MKKVKLFIFLLVLVLHLVFLWASLHVWGHEKTVLLVMPVVQQVSLLPVDGSEFHQILPKPSLKLEKPTLTPTPSTQFALGARQTSPVPRSASAVAIAHSQARSAEALSLLEPALKSSSVEAVPYASLGAGALATPNAATLSSNTANVSLGKAQSTDNTAALGTVGTVGTVAVAQGSGDVMPSSDTAYLHNPKPHYPPISRRLNEQGRVVLHVMIGVDGSAHKATVQQSSGFTRLDQAALAAVLTWRYEPGRRAGVVQSMWLDVAINFVLE